MSTSVAPDSSSAPLAIHLFGAFEVCVNGAPLPRLRSLKGQWLLALLALRAGQEIERAWLAALLWPDSTEQAALANLRCSLKDLRRALGPEGARLRAPTVRTLCLDLTGGAVDVIAFDAAIARGDAASLRETAALYRGPLLERCSEEWVFLERRAREEAYLGALERLAAEALAGGDPAAAADWLRQAVAVDPLRETAQRALMQALADGGNYAAALIVYRELRLGLHREINAEPDAATQALFARIRMEGRAAQRGRSGVRQASFPGPKGTGLPPGKPPEGGSGSAAGSGSPGPFTVLAPGQTGPFRAGEPGVTNTRLSPFVRSIPGRPSEREAVLPAAVLREALKRGRMVGRDAELAELAQRIEMAPAGEGGVVLLAGEPGIGKTRLATEACALARRQGFRVLTGRCDEAGAAPYQPFVEALREYLDSASPEEAEAVLPPPVACELVRLVPRIAEKVKDVPKVAVAAGAAARQALVEAVGECLSLLTGRQGAVLLFLDDLHWADQGSLTVLHALARRAKEQRLLIVGTYRDLPPDLRHPLEETLAALNRERAAERLSLRRLPETGVAEMVGAILDEPLPLAPPRNGEGESSPASREAEGKSSLPSLKGEGELSPPSLAGKGAGGLGPFVSVLHHETEGNPFFIEEVLKHLVEEDAISREEGRWKIKPLQEFSVPQSIKVTIGRRLERLGEESREALTLAAVIGQQFCFEALLQASGLDEDCVLDVLDGWLGAHLVIEERDRAATVRERYRFQHALIREVLYDELSLPRKARLHERVGLALEAVHAGDLEEHLEELAHHYAQARSGAAVEKGVDYCLRAGAKARNLYANEVAIQHLTAALELLEGLPADEPHLRKRWEVVDHLWRAHHECRAFDRARDVLQGHLALAQRVGYPWGAAAAHHWMALAFAWAHWAAGYAVHWSADPLRKEHLEKSLQISEQHGLTDWQARARLDLARGAQHPELGLPRAEALLRQTLQALEGVPTKVIRDTYTELMWICAMQGKWDEVAALLRQSVHLGVPGNLSFCLEAMEEALNRAGRAGTRRSRVGAAGWAEFVAFCEEAKARYARAGLPLALNQWYLEPATPSEEFRQLLFRDDFDGAELRPEWQWHDPVQVSHYSLSERPGHLTLRPGRGVDLWPGQNLNAPRVLLEVSGDFALETKMVGDWAAGHWADEGSFGIDGLLIWKDVLNYVRFEKCGLGRVHRGGMHLEARVAGTHDLFGRGQLWGDAYYLRLERTGDRFAALCSTDGIHWLTCGQVVFPAKDPLRVGVAALYGMVVHFDYVQVLARGDRPSE